MTIIKYPKTNTASNKDWVRASKDMRITAYNPRDAQSPLRTETTDDFTQEKFESALTRVTRKVVNG